MADYDLIARMNGCFNELEMALQDLGISWATGIIAGAGIYLA